MKVGDRVKVQRGECLGKVGKIIAEVFTDVDVSHPEGRTERCSMVEFIVQFDGSWKAMNRLHLEMVDD